MPRTLTASGLAEAQKTTTFYTELFDVQLPTQPNLHLTPSLPTTSSGIAFTIGSIDYQSAGIQRSVVRSNSDTELSSITVRFQNVDQSFGALVENLELRGAPITISGAFIDVDTLTIPTDNLFPVFRGKVGAIRVTEEAINVDIDYALKDIQTDAPRRFYGVGDGFLWSPPVV